MPNRVRLAHACLASAWLFLFVQTQTHAQNPVHIRTSSALSCKLDDNVTWQVVLRRGTAVNFGRAGISFSLDYDVTVTTRTSTPNLTVTLPQGTVVQPVQGNADRVTIVRESLITLPAGAGVTLSDNTAVTLVDATSATLVDPKEVNLPPRAASTAVAPPVRASILVGIPQLAPRVPVSMACDGCVPAGSVVGPSIPVGYAGGYQRFVPSYFYIVPVY